MDSDFAIEHVLLGFIHEQPTHGYDLYQRLSDPAGIGLVWRLKQSQLYALLHKLEAAGYLKSTIEPQESRPPRKTFELTDEGRKAFLAWMEMPVEHGRQLRLEFLAKLYFARHEGQKLAIMLLERQRAACRQWIGEQENQARERRDRPYDWLVHQFRIGQIEAMLSWLDLCEASVTGDGSKR